MSQLLYQASVPVFLRYLERLAGLVDAAEAHARNRGLDIDELLAARLSPDMLPLKEQIAIAAFFALRAAYPLAGEPVPLWGEFAATPAGLRERIAHSATGLLRLRPEQFEAAEARMLEDSAGQARVRLPAADFLFQYALPNFFFHLTTAYAILRARGLPLGKQDFDGFHAYPRPPGAS